MLYFNPPLGDLKASWTNEHRLPRRDFGAGVLISPRFPTTIREMKTSILFVFIMSILVTSCASTPRAYKSNLAAEPAFVENGLEFTKVNDRDLDLAYTIASASTEAIYILVKAKNMTSEPITLDPSIFTLKNDKGERLAAQDPNTVARSVDRTAQHALSEDADLPADRDILASARQSQEYIERNFLKKSDLAPGQSVSGYVLFYGDSPAGRWTLINKVSDKRLSSKQVWFDVVR